MSGDNHQTPRTSKTFVKVLDAPEGRRAEWDAVKLGPALTVVSGVSSAVGLRALLCTNGFASERQMLAKLAIEGGRPMPW